MLQAIFYVIFPLLALIFVYFKRKLSYFKRRGVLHNEPSFLIGNIGGIGKSVHLSDVLRATFEKFKGKDVVCGFYNLTQPIYVVMDGELANSIMIKDFSNFVNRGFFVNEEEEVLTGREL